MSVNGICSMIPPPDPTPPVPTPPDTNETSFPWWGILVIVVVCVGVVVTIGIYFAI
jgi:hypothetical protein